MDKTVWIIVPGRAIIRLGSSRYDIRPFKMV